MMIRTMAAVLVASALSAPLAVQGGPTVDANGDAMIVSVDIPARTGAPTPPSTATPAPPATPVPTATENPAPAAPGSDADDLRPGALPATGGEIALWGAAAGLVALTAGLVIRAGRRRRV
ncbi:MULTISPECIES: LPXTG cell wall anchor domain-containing protein [Microbacterium]|uniref:LPXTG cell wall anchor domain-containing protein n=1 Tax=Microbacterium TaxID=33882 RepID=UPI0027875206|nr:MULTISPECIES: LPXTG cell wall anchor domain-containing protein [Microbacterium]MDQ1082223.1 LPXTG-motif cell wall-anchored protein [Microbacterium sp. SORGH_AS_0344]MDQ1169006.1 LPXTG-motif cell wall-anchored protein [Microbacterium proteolyticum]